MAFNFEKNRDLLSKLGDRRESIAWDAGTVLVGSICMGPVEYFLASHAAGDAALALRFLARGKWILDQAIPRFGGDVNRDPIDLDRPRMALASQLGSILAPDLFGDAWSVPFDAFPRYIEADGRLLEEANAGRILWAFFAAFEDSGDQYQTARVLRLRSHQDFREEMALVATLAELTEAPNHPQWVEYETILARWLNPILATKSYASNFQDMMAGLLSLVWVKHHLGRLDRETLLATYFGETLRVPIVVE
ncbi:MAG: hypothetical protein ACHP7P_15145 [Terriglobales bacterium]